MIPVATLIKDRLRRLERPLADMLFVLLLLANVVAAGWLAARHDTYWDWTFERSNSLSPASLAILQRLDGTLRATVFAAPDTPIARAIGRLLAQYQQADPRMEIGYKDPQLFPEQAREAEVSLTGQVLLEYRGRRRTLTEISERSIDSAIVRLTETRAPWLAVIEGHGERRIDGDAGADLGRLGRELQDQGFLARPLDLATVEEIPDNTRLVLLSMPRIPFFPGEVEALSRYLDRGGNLLWLMDPGELGGLEPLVAQLGLTLLPGVVVDAGAAELGLETPAVAVISSFPPDDPLSAGLTAPAILPGSLALDPVVAPGWTLASYLATGRQSWNETGQIEGRILRDGMIGEISGPLPVVLALSRQLPDLDRQQRVLVTGDGDFLSNAQLGSYGNRALGMRMLSWLSADQSMPELPPPPAAAAPLTLDERQRLLVGLGALVLLPGLFLGLGLAIRWRRWRTR